MHRIGIISDTHGLLRQEVIEILQGCEVILHGGDINCQEILEALGEIAPVYPVRGNKPGMVRLSTGIHISTRNNILADSFG